MDCNKEDILVYAVVVSYNGDQWIKRCIQSLLESVIKLQIIIVDNNSSDTTIEKINSLSADNITLIRNKENIGFGKANNQGISVAYQMNTDFVFLINQDASIQPESVKQLIEVHKNNTQYGILSPMHYNSVNSRIDSGFAKYLSPHYCHNLYLDLIDGNTLNDVYESKFVNAALWLISKECLNKVGGFDPLFFYMGEDTDYVRRTKYNEMKVGICPRIKCYHDRDERTIETKFYYFHHYSSIMLSLLKNSKKYSFLYVKIILAVISISLRVIIKIEAGDFVQLLKAFLSISFKRRKINSSRTESLKEVPFLTQ